MSMSKELWTDPRSGRKVPYKIAGVKAMPTVDEMSDPPPALRSRSIRPEVNLAAVIETYVVGGEINSWNPSLDISLDTISSFWSERTVTEEEHREVAEDFQHNPSPLSDEEFEELMMDTAHRRVVATARTIRIGEADSLRGLSPEQIQARQHTVVTRRAFGATTSPGGMTMDEYMATYHPSASDDEG